MLFKHCGEWHLSFRSDIGRVLSGKQRKAKSYDAGTTFPNWILPLSCVWHVPVMPSRQALSDFSGCWLAVWVAEFDLICWSACPFADSTVNWAICCRGVIDFSTAACSRERNWKGQIKRSMESMAGWGIPMALTSVFNVISLWPILLDLKYIK